jgi:hypothetical protein
MSIVPREVIVDAPAAWNAQADEFNQWDELGEDEKLEWTADRAAEWALEQAADACMNLANKYQQQACADMPTGECLHLLSKGAAAMDCYNAMRALMNGGESDEN